ncbi:TPA: hypothetical protein DCY67_00790 [Candidatus Acetothermia bacterium]|nr:hypothetical protein [Candidatus Acetothermia bacterium]
MNMLRQVAVVLAAAGIVVTGYGLGLCDYRAPTTDFVQGKLSFFYQHVDDPGTAGIDLSTGRLWFEARRQFDSVTEGFGLVGSGEMLFRNLRLVQVLAGATGALRQYAEGPWPVFTFVGFEAGLNTVHFQPLVEAQAGLGFGRFYDVTPLAKALRIEAQLLRLGAIPVSLPNEVVLAVAVAIDQPDEVVTPAERATTVVRLIEREVRRTLDAAAVLLVEEIIVAPGQQRFCGWRVEAGMAYELLDPRAGPRDLLFSFALDGALAPEPGSQLLFRTKISGPYWILDQHTLTLDVTFDYQFDTVTSFMTRYTLRQDKPRGQAPAGTQAAAFQLGFDLGWVGVSIRMEFSKIAEALEWTQNIVIEAKADLW